MIIEDVNFVPYYFDPDAIVMVRLAGMDTKDEYEELPAAERKVPGVMAVQFVLMFGIQQTLLLSHQQYIKLWDRIKDELC